MGDYGFIRDRRYSIVEFVLSQGRGTNEHYGQASKSDESHVASAILDVSQEGVKASGSNASSFLLPLSSLLHHSWLQDSNERQVPVTLRKIEPIANDKEVGNRKADVICADFLGPPRRFIKKHAGPDPLRFQA